jgi:hypothetical protein
MYFSYVEKSTAILSDQNGKFEGFYSSHYYPENLRKIKYYDEETDSNFEYNTINFDINTQEIALFYK